MYKLLPSIGNYQKWRVLPKLARIGSQYSRRMAFPRNFPRTRNLILALTLPIHLQGAFSPSLKFDDKEVPTAQHEDLEEEGSAEDGEESPEYLHYKYIIVGSGVSAYWAVLGIREKDPTGDIVIISPTNQPFMPPALLDLWDAHDIEE